MVIGKNIREFSFKALNLLHNNFYELRISSVDITLDCFIKLSILDEVWQVSNEVANEVRRGYENR